MGTEKRTRTLVIEETELGVRITAAGSRYVVRTGSNDAHNLSTVEISDRWITDFAPGEQNRAAYAAKHCTDNCLLHPREGCDGLCHDNCSEPADFFEHHKRPDGTESSLPYCKSHAQDMAQLVGRAVLFAVDFGGVHDLRFWNHDLLPDGSIRCDHRYRAFDDYGLTWARCTRTVRRHLQSCPKKQECPNENPNKNEDRH